MVFSLIKLQPCYVNKPGWKGQTAATAICLSHSQLDYTHLTRAQIHKIPNYSMFPVWNQSLFCCYWELNKSSASGHQITGTVCPIRTFCLSNRKSLVKCSLRVLSIFFRLALYVWNLTSYYYTRNYPSILLNIAISTCWPCLKENLLSEKHNERAQAGTNSKPHPVSEFGYFCILIFCQKVCSPHYLSPVSISLFCTLVPHSSGVIVCVLLDCC